MAIMRRIVAWLTHRYWLWRMSRRWTRINKLLTKAIATQTVIAAHSQGQWYHCPTCGLNWVNFDEQGIQGVIGMRQCGACEVSGWRWGRG